MSLVALAAVVPWTTDEPNYFAAGLAIAKHLDFEAFSTILHGPLPFLCNQVFLPGDLVATDAATLAGLKLQARLGMVPLSMLAGLFLALFCREAFGPRVALGALLLWVTDPMVLGHGPLITADMALCTFWVLTAWATWRYLSAPSMVRLALVGVALGISLATKYLALFLIPAIGAAGALACACGVRPGLWWSKAPDAGPLRRVADLLPVGILCGVIALPVLHTCYLWSAGGYDLRAPQALEGLDPQDPEAGPLSGTFRALADVPAAGAALALLPAPFVRGVDYQKFYSERGGRSYFAGAFGPGFAGYFPTALLVKMPLLTLLLLVAGLAVRRPPWPPHLRGLLAWLIAVPLVYLSLFTVLQIGVRYLLPVIPLLMMVAARPLGDLVATRNGRRGAAVIAALLVGSAALDAPRFVEAFNVLAGQRPYLLFADSNLTWRHRGWSPDTDVVAMQRRHPDSQRLFLLSGARLGQVHAHGVDLCRGDPHDQHRAHHWLRRFDPVDRVGPWFLFDIDEAGFRAAVADDPRGRAELALALLGEGRTREALTLLDGNEHPDAAVVRQAAGLLAAEDLGPAWGQLMLQLGRFDLVLGAEGLPPFLRAAAHAGREEHAAVRDLLLATERERPLSLPEALILAEAWRRLEDPEAGIAAIEKYAPPADDPGQAAVREACDKRLRDLRAEIAALRLVERKATGASEAAGVGWRFALAYGLLAVLVTALLRRGRPGQRLDDLPTI